MSDQPQSPEAQGAALSELKNHPGWALFCAEFKRECDAIAVQALEAKDDTEANKLRVQWQRVRELSPSAMRDRMEKNARSRAAKGFVT